MSSRWRRRPSRCCRAGRPGRRPRPCRRTGAAPVRLPAASCVAVCAAPRRRPGRPSAGRPCAEHDRALVHAVRACPPGTLTLAVERCRCRRRRGQPRPVGVGVEVDLDAGSASSGWPALLHGVLEAEEDPVGHPVPRVAHVATSARWRPAGGSRSGRTRPCRSPTCAKSISGSPSMFESRRQVDVVDRRRRGPCPSTGLPSWFDVGPVVGQDPPRLVGRVVAVGVELVVRVVRPHDHQVGVGMRLTRAVMSTR